MRKQTAYHRLYGVTFLAQKELDAYLLMLEEAKKETTANWVRNWVFYHG